MSSVIWKYRLPIGGTAKIDMPSGSKILSVSSQVDDRDCYFICLHAIVNPEADLETRSFTVFATGHEQPFDLSGLNFIGTASTGIRNFYKWHVFETTGVSL